MEHQTMTTLENLSFVMVSHELAHQWFGDFVTCNSWQDIWINEGFASYAEYLAYQHLVSQEKADQWMTSAQEMVKMRPGGSVFIPESGTDDVGRIFDYRLSYKKGAAIIHMIRHEINDDSLFFDILRDFLSRYRNRTASALDFRDLLEERTSMDFAGFFDQWYFGEGYPDVTCLWQQRNDTIYIQASQTTTSSTPIFNLRLDFRITINGNDSLLTRRVDSNPATWVIPVKGEVTAVQPDPSNWLLGKFACFQDNLLSYKTLTLMHPSENK
jgi:aminopeptidase N